MKTRSQKYKIYGFGLWFLIFGFLPASAAEYTLIAPLPNTNTAPDFTTYLQALFPFLLSIAAGLAFVMIVIGGIFYITSAGNPAAISSAKDRIKAALIGLLIAVSSYLIINAINPNLLNLDFSGSLTPITATSGTSGTTSSSSGGGSCTPITNGPCSVASLGSSCFGSVASEASSICNVESGGIPTAESTIDITADGHSFSIGLFQINLTANSVGSLNCPSAFQGTNKSATVVNMPLYEACVSNAKNSGINISTACAVYQAAGSSWSPWTTAASCGL